MSGVENKYYTQDGDGVFRCKTDPSVEARGWQGMDKFAGKDSYENKVLEGSKSEIKLAKLKYSNSGYFMLYDEYNALREADGLVDSQKLSEGLQVAPWRNPYTGQYEYQNAVTIYTLDRDLEVAYGEQTLANLQYGKGKLTQIYIPGYDSENQMSNEAIGLKIVGEENLNNAEITEEQFKSMGKKNAQHIAKRDLFLQRATTERLLETMEQTKDVELMVKCDEHFKCLELLIKRNAKKIKMLQGEAKGNDVPSATYDDMIQYLEEKSVAGKDGDFEIRPEIEAKIEEVRKDLIRQIDKNLWQDSTKRDIEITDSLKEIYEADMTCIIAEQMKDLEVVPTEQKEILLERRLINLNDGMHQKLSLKMEIKKVGDQYKLIMPEEKVGLGSPVLNPVNKIKDTLAR